MKFKLAISIVLALLAFIFITQNTDLVKVDFLAWSVEISLVLLLVIMLGAGVIIGWLLNSYQRFSYNRRVSRTTPVVQAKKANDSAEEKSDQIGGPANS